MACCLLAGKAAASLCRLSSLELLFWILVGLVSVAKFSTVGSGKVNG